MDYDKGVSPVIGVILMIVITLILAIFISVFVLDLGGSESVKAGVSVDQNQITLIDKNNADKVIIKSQEGDILNNLTSVGDTIKIYQNVSVIGVKNDKEQVIRTVQIKNPPTNKIKITKTSKLSNNPTTFNLTLINKEYTKTYYVSLRREFVVNPTIITSSPGFNNINDTVKLDISNPNRLGKYKFRLINGNYIESSNNSKNKFKKLYNNGSVGDSIIINSKK